MPEMEGFCRSVSRRFAGKEPETIITSKVPNDSYPLFEPQNGCKLNADGTSPQSATRGFLGNGKASYGDVILCKCRSATKYTELGNDGGFKNGFCA